MYKKPKKQETTISVDQSYIGETIEEKVNRIVNNNEPITDGAPLTYTNRADGVLPDYDIRTDRWEAAVDAMDKISKTHIAKREERAQKVNENKETETKNEGGAQPTHGTDQPQ